MTHPTPPPAPSLGHGPSTCNSKSTSTTSPPAKFTTTILPVDPTSIHFTPSPHSPHPFSSPTLRLTCPATESALRRASHLLHTTPHPIAFPTETVYGLGAPATHAPSITSIFAAKRRPQDNPLIVHISSLTQLTALLPSTPLPEIYLPLIHRFWPGPLTILLPLPADSPLAPNVTAGQTTFAVRMPSHPIALALAHLTNLPIAAPSANASGKPSPTTAAHVLRDLEGRIELILDGGQAEVGVESTVVSGLCNPPRVLRPGGVTVEMIREVGGVWGGCVAGGEGLRSTSTNGNDKMKNGVNGVEIPIGKSGQVDINGSEVPLVPGMKYRHYSPKAKVILYEPTAAPPTVADLLASIPTLPIPPAAIGIIRSRTWPPFSPSSLPPNTKLRIEELPLGTTGAEISRGLFAALREMDERGVGVIHVEGIGEEDEGLAVMNRLRKAAGEVVR